MRASVLGIAAVLSLTATADAQDRGVLELGLDGALELRAHRALAELRAAPDTVLEPFTTDGCSGGLSEVWSLVAASFPAFAQAHRSRPPWEACCVEHDRAYHRGGDTPGAEASYQSRLDADAALRACVKATAFKRSEDLSALYGMTPLQIGNTYGTIAEAMYLAVRFGGAPCTGLSWRWGYGYPPCP